MNKSALNLINSLPLQILLMTFLPVLALTKTRGPYPSSSIFRQLKSVVSFAVMFLRFVYKFWKFHISCVAVLNFGNRMQISEVFLIASSTLGYNNAHTLH